MTRHDTAQSRPDAVAEPNVAAAGLSISIHDLSDSASRAVAAEMADPIRDKTQRGGMAVLGLATGSTPQSVSDELVRLQPQHRMTPPGTRCSTHTSADELYHQLP